MKEEEHKCSDDHHSHEVNSRGEGNFIGDYVYYVFFISHIIICYLYLSLHSMGTLVSMSTDTSIRNMIIMSTNMR